MKDFRSKFYRKYHSAFKSHLSDYNNDVIKTEWRWYDYKYLPLLKKYARDASILEVGCGRGIMLDYLKNQGFINIIGIDISEEQISIAKSKNLNVQVSDVFQYFNDKKEKYDIIIALDFIEHFSKDEIIELFESFYNHLNLEGCLIIHTPNGQAFLSHRMIYGDLTHMMVFSPYSLQQILKLVGFKELYFFEKDPDPKNIKGIIRLVLWKIVKSFYNILMLIETGRTEKILTQNFICQAKKT
jgi:2-polyprenyl-3-methyl-5-hydroxy-6-metoxy-1,4-benzoquinol methylase